MVVGDDTLWSSYLKAHPEAFVYKTKPVLNFNDLCLIYGYTIANGRYIRSSHDLEFEDETHGVDIGENSGSLVHLSRKSSKTEWTPVMDQFFIELMLDQIGKGNKNGNAFSKQAWIDMLALFNARFNGQYEKMVLRHRYNKMSKYYNDIGVILKEDGFCWDETQQMIAADDAIWDSYIKVCCGIQRDDDGRRNWRRRKLAKKDDMLRYKLQRVPFVEEQVRKIREVEKVMTIFHVLSNRVNDLGFDRPKAYVESDPFKLGPGYLKEEFT